MISSTKQPSNPLFQSGFAGLPMRKSQIPFSVHIGFLTDRILLVPLRYRCYAMRLALIFRMGYKPGISYRSWTGRGTFEVSKLRPLNRVIRMGTDSR